VTQIPVAAFLAGSILTLALPLFVVIGLAVWYAKTARHIPAPAPNPGPAPAELGMTEPPATPPSEGDEPHDA